MSSASLVPPSSPLPIVLHIIPRILIIRKFLDILGVEGGEGVGQGGQVELFGEGLGEAARAGGLLLQVISWLHYGGVPCRPHVISFCECVGESMEFCAREREYLYHTLCFACAQQHTVLCVC